MRLMFSLAVLVVWLFFELKDFFYNGGLTHSLAFGLLKITVILILILVLGTIVLTMNLLPMLFNQIINIQQIHTNNNKPQKITRPKELLPNTKKIKRKNSF